MKFEIKPHEGVNDIRFGMSQKEVEEKLPGGEFKAIRNPSPDFLTYIYWQNEDAAFFYFGTDGLLEEIEFSREMILSLQNTKLDTSAASKLKGSLAEMTDDLSDDKDGFQSKSLGVGVWIQDMDDDLIGSILISP